MSIKLNLERHWNKEEKIKMIIEIKCKNCGILFLGYISQNREFCNFECYRQYCIQNEIGFWNNNIRKLAGKSGSLKNYNRDYKLKRGFYSDRSHEKSHNTQKKKKIGFWGYKNKKPPSIETLEKSHETNSRNKTGVYSLHGISTIDGNKKTQNTLKKKKLGSFYNEKLRIIAVRKAREVVRQNIRNLFFEGQYYDSKPEIEISLCLQEQYNYKPEEKISLHKDVGKLEYDYVLKILQLFVECHPITNLDKRTPKQYYDQRRYLLNTNGYKNYNLIVIK